MIHIRTECLGMSLNSFLRENGLFSCHDSLVKELVEYKQRNMEIH